MLIFLAAMLQPRMSYAACFGPFLDFDRARAACNSQLAPNPDADCINEQAQSTCGGYYHAVKLYRDCLGGPGEGCSFPYYSGSCPAGEWVDPESGVCKPVEENPAPAKNLGSCSDAPSDFVGNPVKVSTGNNYLRETDHEGFGRGILRFERTYNSGLAMMDPPQPVWRNTYDRRIRDTRTPSGRLRVADRPDGSSIYFHRSTATASTWYTDEDVHERLEHTTTSGVIIEYRLTLTSGTVERYDGNGILQSITDRAGRVQVLVYDSSGRLERVDSSAGEYFLFGYDAQDRLASLTDHAGRVWVYGYDADDNLEVVYYPDGSLDTHTNNPYRKYHYEDDRFQSALTGISDIARGKEERYANWEYDDSGRATVSYHGPRGGVPAERVDGVVIGYDAPFTRTVTDSRGGVRTFTVINQLGRYRLAGIARPGCANCSDGGSSYTYEPGTNRLLTSTTKGVTTEYGEFTGKGEPGFRMEAVGTLEERRIDYTYDQRLHGRVATRSEASVNPAGKRVTSMTYDDYGNLAQESVSGYAPDGLGGWSSISRTTRYRYDGPFHQLSQIDGPRTDVNDVTTFRYYDNDPSEGNNRARLKEVIDAAGVLIRSNILYTATGRILSEDRPNGLRIHYTYYPGNDRLATMARSDGALSRVTRWTYLETGEIESITSAYGTADATTITLGYDLARRLTRVSDGLGNYIEYRLDTQGNREEENIHDSNGMLRKSLRQTFDAYNQLDFAYRENEAVDHDISADGVLDRQVDGNNHVTEFDYDGLNRLMTSTRDPGGLDAKTEYGFDAGGRLDHVTDPNNGTTSYAYDDLGNLSSVDSPDTGVTVYTRDAAGNVKTRVDSKGQLFSYSYDILNRLIRLDAPGTAGDITYTYDSCAYGVGRLCRVAMGETVASYSYDAFGNVVGHQQLGYSHDTAGHLDGVSYPSGAMVTYDHDAAGRVSKVDLHADGKVTTLASGIESAPFGGISGLVYGNGKTLSQGYDSAYRMTHQRIPAVLEIDYRQYDGAGNLGLLDDVLDVVSSFYRYDSLDRLDAASGPFGDREYGYGLNGNRTRLNDNAGATVYSYEPSSNRIANEGEWNYLLDANGNTVSRMRGDVSGEGRSFSWTVHDRLASVTDHVLVTSGKGKRRTTTLQDMHVSTYAYNGLGQRVRKQVNGGGAVRYLYGNDGALMAEMDDTGNVLREYVYLDGRLLAVLDQVAGDETPAGAEVVMGDGDPGASESGNWAVKSSNKAHAGDYRLAEGGGNSYRWTPELGAGLYDVYVWYVKHRSLGNAPYRIEHAGQSTTVTVDQSRGGGAWYRIASALAFDGSGGEYVEVSDSNGKTVADAVRFVNVTGGTDSGTITKVYYVHNDRLGTPQVMTDGAATVVWRASYDPFGKAEVVTDAVELNVRFPGQYFDQETGLHYNYFRYYDPGTGRYLTSDPIGLYGGLNTYAYAMGNPLSFFDPLGLEVVGRWVQKPIPFVSDATVEFGRGNARRPDDWWKIWRNLGTYRAMEHRVSVKSGFNWEVRCVDTEECSGDSWDIDGGWEDWMDVWVSISTPAIPHPGGYYAFLARNAYSLLIQPATSKALEQVTQAANVFGMVNAPTWICKNYPRQGN